MLGTGKRIWSPINDRKTARGLFLLVFMILGICSLGRIPPAAAQGSASSPSPDEGLADMEEFAGAEAPIGEQPLTELDPVDSADEDKYRGVEEILVTARGGTQNVQDISTSIAAFDADYLEALGAQNIADLSQFTPNLEIRTVFAASNPTLFIRGVGLRDFNSNSSSAVAVYNDDIYMNSPAGQLGQLFDVQQVEVLRGPQGTLYGRNASAGAIRVITRKPSGDTNGYTKLTYGKYNEVETEAAMEVPITNTISIRVSGRMRKRDGYTKNRCADPQYNSPGEPNTFASVVHKACFNDQTDPPEIPLIPSSAIGHYDAALGDFVFPTPPLGGIPQWQDPVFYPQYYDHENFRVVPWYPAAAVVGGIPNPGAPPFPSKEQCGLPGCVYLADPGTLPGVAPLFFPENYFDQGWESGKTPTDIKPWTNNVDNWATRGLVRWQPSKDIDWILNIHGGMNRGDSPQFQGVGARQGLVAPVPDLSRFENLDNYIDPDLITFTDGRCNSIRDCEVATRPEDGDPFAGDYNLDGAERLNLYGTSLTGAYTFGDDAYLFRTISGFEGNQREVTTNLDAGPYPLGLEPHLRNSSWQLSQEFKFNWEDDNAWSVEAGANYLYEELEVYNSFPQISNITEQSYTLVTQYSSVYAWVDWHPAETFSVTAGGRWNFEVKDMDLTTSVFSRNFVSGAIDPGNPDVSGFATEHVVSNAPSGDVTLTYEPTDARLVFLKYSRGYKGPHVNGLVLNARNTDIENQSLTSPVKPEKVDSLEFGLKTSWLENQLVINGAVFYYSYQDIQIFQLRNSGGSLPVSQLINADDSDVYGAEVEVRAQPLYGLAPESVDGLEVFLSFGWLHGRYTEFANRISYVNDDGIERFLTEENSGNRLVNSPEIAFAGYANWPLRSRFGVLTPRLDWSYKSKVFFSPQNLDPVSQDPLWLLNFRIGYTTPANSIELAGWIRNVTNVVYRVDVINLARTRSSILYFMGQPRTYGVTLNVKF